MNEPFYYLYGDSLAKKLKQINRDKINSTNTINIINNKTNINNGNNINSINISFGS